MQLLPIVISLLTFYGSVGPPVTVTLDAEQTYQEIDGFGTAIINYKDFPPEYRDTAFINRVVNDLGLSLLRLPLTEQLEYINDDDDPDHFNWSNFHLSDNYRRKGLDSTMALAAAFRRAGVERFMMSPWSPPQFMKTNRSPIQGGFLRHDMTEEFAEYLAAAVLLAKHNYGIDINWLSLQNESIFIQFYRSCLYHPEMMREAVRAVMRKFKREGIATKLLINEDMLFADRIFHGVRPTLEDPETGNFDGHIAVHRKQGKEGLLELRRLLQPYNRKLWMTETSGHDANWPGAFKLANDMHDYLVYGNFSAWLYWQISGNTGASDPGRYTLMLEGEPTKKYFAAKHFYRYVRPGAVRIGVTTSTAADSLKVAAFAHPTEGTLTLTLINNTAESSSVSLRANNEVLPDTLSYFLTTETSDCEQLAGSPTNTPIAIPAHSIVTLYGRLSETQPPGQAVTVVTTTDQLPAGKLGNSSPFPAKIDWQAAADGSPALLDRARAYHQTGNIDSARFTGWTILHNAALNGDCAALRYALTHGADVNATARDGWTPLHAAASTFVGSKEQDGCTKYDVFATVLAAGPDLNARTDDGLTALHAAVINANTSFRKDERETLARITDLIVAGAQVNARDKAGRTPLHWAAAQGYTHFDDNKLRVEGDVVALLLQHGADAAAVDGYGKRAIDYATDMGYTSVIDVLTTGSEAQPTTSTSTQKPFGPELLTAAWRGEVAEVKRLLQLGADTRYVDTDGFTALERARDNGFTEIVELITTHDQE